MKTIIFDFDGTLTKKNNEIWQRIWVELDAVNVDNYLYDKFNKGELNYSTWCEEIEKEYIKRKFHKSTLDKLVKDIEMMDNVEDTLIELKKRNYNLCILSGGIDYNIYYLLGENKKYFDAIMCDKFVFDENGYLTKIIERDSDGEGKARFINKYIKEKGCKPSDIIFIGNGNNDRFVSETGCHTICLNPFGTNHLDNNIWHNYIESTTDFKDIIKVIDKIEAMQNKR